VPIASSHSGLRAGPFTGLWIPLVTPFNADGNVDHAALAALVRRLKADGVSGFVACGTTGEPAAMDDAEQDAVLATVLTAAAGLPVVMGLSGYHQSKLCARAQALSAQPIAGLLVPPPCYIRPSQDGLLQWFNAIADASRVPLLVYDIPYRTGVTMALETLLALTAHPRIAGLKDCGGDSAKTQALIADGRLQVLAGEDTQVFTTAALGGAGAITASAHVHTRRFVQVLQLATQGELGAARRLWQPLLPLVDALFAEPNPGPVKALLALQGAMRAELRAPMTAATPAHVAQLERLSAALTPV
jgi:4-hydroxy-tetrahydrodipicolinate synthase